jgi:hypothetical protein
MHTNIDYFMKSLYHNLKNYGETISIKFAQNNAANVPIA